MDTRLRELLDEHAECRKNLVETEQDMVEFDSNNWLYLTKLKIRLIEANRFAVEEVLETDITYYKERILEIEYDIKQIRKLSRAIAEMCVVKNLPSGDPCWVARLIGTYIEIPAV
jgi:hypothetical protein